MNQFTKEMLTKIEEYAFSKGFIKKGKQSFLRKNSSLKREELWSVQIRKGRSPYQDQDYISTAVGIYYPEVRKLEKKVIKDFLYAYPIIGGATGIFTNSSNYEEFQVVDSVSVKLAFEKIINEFEEGGIGLFNSFPNLESISDGIITKHHWLDTCFLNPNVREKITIASIMFVCHGKESAIKWLELNILNENEGKDILERFSEL